MIINPPKKSAANLQNKTITPTTDIQTITADANYDGLGEILVNAIPSTYKKIRTGYINCSDPDTEIQSENNNRRAVFPFLGNILYYWPYISNFATNDRIVCYGESYYDNNHNLIFTFYAALWDFSDRPIYSGAQTASVGTAIVNNGFVTLTTTKHYKIYYPSQMKYITWSV